MKASQEIDNLKDLVYELLVINPKLRDSDRKLSARIWAIQLGGLEKIKKINAFEFLCIYAENNSLCSQESIGRARRLIQEKNVELRGDKYKERQDEQDDVIKVIKTDLSKQDKNKYTEENVDNKEL